VIAFALPIHDGGAGHIEHALSHTGSCRRSWARLPGHTSGDGLSARLGLTGPPVSRWIGRVSPALKVVFVALAVHDDWPDGGPGQRLPARSTSSANHDATRAGTAGPHRGTIPRPYRVPPPSASGAGRLGWAAPGCDNTKVIIRPGRRRLTASPTAIGPHGRKHNRNCARHFTHRIDVHFIGSPDHVDLEANQVGDEVPGGNKAAVDRLDAPGRNLSATETVLTVPA
jgi:hypothetical protein